MNNGQRYSGLDGSSHYSDARLQGRRPKRLVSSNGCDHTRRFADLTAAVAKLSARTLVLDGEVAILDQRLPSRFDWLREPDPAAVATPPILIAFDIMYRDRRDLTGLPLSARRVHREDVIAGADLMLPVRRLAANGLDAWARARGVGSTVTRTPVPPRG